MRVFTIQPHCVSESDEVGVLLSQPLPPNSFVWIACERDAFERTQGTLQNLLQTLCGAALVDLHVSDLLNQQLPSHYDYTSDYDMLVFRRLVAAAQPQSGAGTVTNPPPLPPPVDIPAHGEPILRRVDTSPVGFVVFERVLLTVHPSDCAVRDTYAAKLALVAASAESRAAGARMPSSAADLMLRIINLMVDGYLALRRVLTHQIDHWQTDLLNPKTRFHNWTALLDARLSLHQLDEVCEEQRSCIQDWIEAVKTWPPAATPEQARERELLQVRSRDVLEHIERVVTHVRRLEQSTETAVQMHFSAQSHRTNDIMRTLTALTAIFLPLNLIAGIFGMNFEFIPLLHWQSGFWWAMGSMLAIAVALAVVFWRKRYLARTGR